MGEEQVNLQKTFHFLRFAPDHARALASVLLLALSYLGCERSIPLGTFTDGSNDGGNNNDISETPGGRGGAPSTDASVAFPGTLAFSSDFESANLSAWGINEAVSMSAGGEVRIDAAESHTGNYSAQVVTAQTGEHVIVSVSGNWSELLISYYLRLDELYQTQNWPILHIDTEQGEALEQLWDLGLDSSNGLNYLLYLRDMPSISNTPDGGRVATSETGISIGEWSHIQVHLLARSDETGFIKVLLDGQPVLNLTNRRTGTGAPLHIGFGSFAYELEPRPATYLLDDVEIFVP